jgi:hypothetical protein
MDNWKNRSKNMRCGKCMYWVQKSNLNDPNLAELGRCRKHAPTLDGWPPLFETDWCGDHKLDEEKL